MNKHKNILICGLGAIGGYYASVIFSNPNYCLKILVDKFRYDKYTSNPRIINGKIYNFDYILPDNNNFKADIIIIATKSSGLSDAIINIKNFVSENTVILSFLNGITSEQKIAEIYGKEKVIRSYLLGHTFFRQNNEICHDGKAKIIFGSTDSKDKKIDVLTDFFKNVDVQYEVSNNILYSQWQKFAFNCCVNQISAITHLTFGQMKSNYICMNLMKSICAEITQISNAIGIKGDVDYFESTVKSLDLMIPDGKTSMLQDIESGVIPETEIFGKSVYKLGKKYGIDTPVNKTLSDLIELSTS